MADTLSAVAGAIPVVGGIISNAINNADVNSNNAANRAFQEQQQLQQEQYNTQQWQAQAEYNSPAEQMARLQAAGLNPNMVYGAGSITGNVAELPAPAPRVEYVSQPKTAPDLAGEAASAVKAFNDTRLGTPQVSNLKAQTQNTNEDTMLKQVQELLDTLQGNKVSAEIPTVQPSAQANIDQLNSSTFKNITDANVNSFLAPFSAEVMDANTEKAKADTNFVVSDNVRQAALTATNIKEAVARMGKMAVDNAKSQAEINEINTNVQTLLNSKALSDMDIQMRKSGMMPHDSVPMRILGGLSTLIFGSKSGTTFTGANAPTTPQH